VFGSASVERVGSGGSGGSVAETLSSTSAAAFQRFHQEKHRTFRAKKTLIYIQQAAA